ncbi:MAG: 30S ribosomal protein S15 [Patescibacteria group bacterium]
MMKRDTKKKLITKHALHEKDTGSARVQVAILTTRINELSEHLKTHKKDNHSRRGLLKLVGQRRSHLLYLKTKNKEDYEKLLDQLDLRK